MQRVNFILPIAALLLSLAFGFWLSHKGKPYHPVLFNVHKLLALGVVILMGLQFVRYLRGVEGTLLFLLVLAGAALLVIALFTSGALMSADKYKYAILRAVHRLASATLVLALLGLFYLLSRG